MFEKFEFSLMVTPDYPFGPLHVHDFKKHVGDTRFEAINIFISQVEMLFSGILCGDNITSIRQDCY